jgi:hypothetical protein
MKILAFSSAWSKKFLAKKRNFDSTRRFFGIEAPQAKIL